MATALTPPQHDLTPLERKARAEALDRELCRLHRRGKQCDAAMARRLVELEDAQGYVELGFGSLNEYAYARFGWRSAKVRDPAGRDSTPPSRRRFLRPAA